MISYIGNSVKLIIIKLNLGIVSKSIYKAFCQFIIITCYAHSFSLSSYKLNLGILNKSFHKHSICSNYIDAQSHFLIAVILFEMYPLVSLRCYLNNLTTPLNTGYDKKICQLKSKRCAFAAWITSLCSSILV